MKIRKIWQLMIKINSRKIIKNKLIMRGRINLEDFLCELTLTLHIWIFFYRYLIYALMSFLVFDGQI